MVHKISPTLQRLAQSTARDRHWQLAGHVHAGVVAHWDRLLRRDLPSRGGNVTLHMEQVQGLDPAATAWLVACWRQATVAGVSLQLQGASADVYTSLNLFVLEPEAPGAPPASGFWEHLGGVVATASLALRDFLVLASDVTVGAVWALLRPHTVRWAAVVQESSLIGSRALGIVGLITFLIGLTLAFQSAYQLRQFGAAIYVASLTAISMVREMGPLITAILVAGRSGSSITAEVATMQVGQELDALKVMGIPFLDYVAIPKVIAMVAMVPLLTMLADVLGILGGWVVGTVYLDIAPQPYLQRTLDALVTKDLITGLIKSVVFAWGIALIGLFYGVQVRGGAQEVGRATTASVVSAIFFIIVADSLFSILFYVVMGT
jgi:phospholipid/cholesterol/gamma-HCH transport system permease protein